MAIDLSMRVRLIHDNGRTMVVADDGRVIPCRSVRFEHVAGEKPILVLEIGTERIDAIVSGEPIIDFVGDDEIRNLQQMADMAVAQIPADWPSDK